MDLRGTLRNGMRVVGPDNREYGTIDRYDDAAVYVQGQRVPFAAVGRVDRDRLILDEPDLWRLSNRRPPNRASAARPASRSWKRSSDSPPVRSTSVRSGFTRPSRRPRRFGAGS